MDSYQSSEAEISAKTCNGWTNARLFALVLHCDHNLIRLMYQVQSTHENGVGSRMKEETTSGMLATEIALCSNVLSLLEVFLQSGAELFRILDELLLALLHRLFAGWARNETNHLVHCVQ